MTPRRGILLRLACLLLLEAFGRPLLQEAEPLIFRWRALEATTTTTNDDDHGSDDDDDDDDDERREQAFLLQDLGRLLKAAQPLICWPALEVEATTTTTVTLLQAQRSRCGG